MAKAGGARMIAQGSFTPVELAKQMQKLALEPDALANAAERARAVGRPDAARALADLVERIGRDPGRRSAQFVRDQRRSAQHAERGAGMKGVGTDIGTIHFVGIGGIGMSGIAEVMHILGYKVQGSDVAEGYVVEGLRERGIPIDDRPQPPTISATPRWW